MFASLTISISPYREYLGARVRGKHVTQEERFLIRVLNDEGYSKREIGRRFRRSEHLVRTCLQKTTKNKKSVKGSTRNTKLSKCQIGQLKQEATKNKLYSS